MKRQVLVIGLGRFGSSAAIELTRLGHEVLAVDSDARLIQAISDDVTHAVQADATDEDALSALGVADFDTAIVGVSDIEVSILACVLLKRLGVRRVILKAASVLHAEILQRVGADRVVFPEREMGIRVAHSFAAPIVSDYLDVAPGYGLARIQVQGDLVGKTLGELDLARSHGLSPLLLRRDQQVMVTPDRTERLRAGDDLIVAGADDKLAEFRV